MVLQLTSGMHFSVTSMQSPLYAVPMLERRRPWAHFNSLRLNTSRLARDLPFKSMIGLEIGSGVCLGGEGLAKGGLIANQVS